MFNALVLAGTKEKGPLEIAENVNNKALIMLESRPMIDYIIDALNSSENIGRVLVVGPKNELHPYIGKKVDEILNPGNSILENMEIGLNFFNSADNLLLLTSDIPLITSKAIDEFLEICTKRKAYIGYPIITKENIVKKYPETKRTYVKMKEGIFCGGNIVFFKPEVFFQKKKLIKELFDNRKATWKYVKILSLKFILKFLFKTLTLEEIEKRVTDILGYNSIAAMISYPEVMIDLDKPSDLKLIRKCLER
ncbi:molybdopterin-guanine dinucleotide biosynthesis protein A [Candidatus Atribacteria bacterium 1244-E10-H5-B2]|nr:MAG: molybdopterin-guanine dinucleotide biosynthesis protein A [Candidatus Atribacteria bacterium 1244-E10-H5-B2]